MGEKKEEIIKETKMDKFKENLLVNEDEDRNNNSENEDRNDNSENEDHKSINKTEEINSNIEEEEMSIEATLQKEIEQLRDEKLRLLAEMENIRKRSDRDRADLIKYGSINLARDILSPDDNLTRALEAIPEAEKKTEAIINLVDALRLFS